MATVRDAVEGAPEPSLPGVPADEMSKGDAVAAIAVAVEDPNRPVEEEKALYAVEARSRGQPVPNFLLPKDDPLHQPPHLAITELSARLVKRHNSPYLAAADPQPGKPHNEAMRLQRLVWESGELDLVAQTEQAAATGAGLVEGENDPLTIFKNIYSTILLIFSAVSIHGLIFNNLTKFSEETSSGWALLLFWAAIGWLAMIEGGQASHVGLHAVDKELYKDSHPVAYRCADHCNKGDNLNRYLLGRQFGVIFVVFCVNLCGAPKADDDKCVGNSTYPGVNCARANDLWGYPDWITSIFFSTGFAMILFTCMVGQLNTQVNASIRMLDFVNNRVCLFTYWGCIFVEFTGFVHFSYALQKMVAAATGKPIQSKDEPKSALGSIFFWLRVLWSFAILTFSLVVTIAALFDGKTTMWAGVPNVIAVILFFSLMSVVGMLEGMQIAFFAVAKLTEAERGDNTWAKKTCEILYNKRNGLNLPAFMIGRQLCVVTCFFVVARVTTQEIEDGEENVMGLPDAVQNFLNYGFQGALITTILGSISWQLVAGAFPIAFLSNPVTYYLLRLCLLLEATGVCNGAWVLAAIHRRISGLQKDEVYIGTAEDRKAREVLKQESGKP
jgi:hypothetical protein